MNLYFYTILMITSDLLYFKSFLIFLISFFFMILWKFSLFNSLTFLLEKFFLLIWIKKRKTTLCFCHKSFNYFRIFFSCSIYIFYLIPFHGYKSFFMLFKTLLFLLFLPHGNSWFSIFFGELSIYFKVCFIIIKYYLFNIFLSF